jgi:hypothetical protein
MVNGPLGGKNDYCGPTTSTFLAAGSHRLLSPTGSPKWPNCESRPSHHWLSLATARPCGGFSARPSGLAIMPKHMDMCAGRARAIFGRATPNGLARHYPCVSRAGSIHERVCCRDRICPRAARSRALIIIITIRATKIGYGTAGLRVRSRTNFKHRTAAR